MANWPGIRAALALVYRPALALPHLVVPSIAHLDWRALKAAGVRAVVFDRDNCLSRPHAFTVEPHIAPSFDAAIATFGLSRILIVSNSAGSSSDTNGIRAERLSREFGGVPVLCHPQKKPGRQCARMVIEHFEQVQNGLVRAIPYRSGGDSTCGEGRSADLEESGRKEAVATDERPFEGSIAVVGDRTLTDVALAHRIGDELRKLRGVRSDVAEQASSSSVSAPAPGDEGSELPDPRQSPSVAILTSGIWAREGLVNDLMRYLERSLVNMLRRRGFKPGQRGWRPLGVPRAQIGHEAIARPVQRPSYRPQALFHRLLRAGVAAAERSPQPVKLPRHQPQHQFRLFSTAHPLRVQASPPKGETGAPGQQRRPQTQMNRTRVLGALLGFFVVVPLGVLSGFRLKAWTEERELRARKEAGGVQLSESDESMLEAEQLSRLSDVKDAERRAKLRRLQELKTEEYLMLQEQRDVEEKMARLQTRRATQ